MTERMGQCGLYLDTMCEVVPEVVSTTCRWWCEVVVVVVVVVKMMEGGGGGESW